MAQTYSIIIDDDQRLLLIAALSRLSTKVTDDLESRDSLIDMLTDLPDQESDSPGVLHGLCL